MLQIVTDGAIDMPPAWEQEYGIHVIPLRVSFGDVTYTQGEGFTHADFYRLVEEKRMIPKTSLPSIGQVQEFLRSIAHPGDTILSIHISSRLSGTFSTVESASRELAGEFKIFVFDTLAGSAAQAFMAREARILDRAGAAMPEIMARLEKIRQRINISFTLDTLDYAYMNGRINALQSLVVAALQIKPIVELRDGLLEITDKVRTRQRALNQVVQKMCDHLGSRPINAAVLHAGDPEAGRSMYETVRERLNVVDSFTGEVTIPIAANLGPRAIGVIAYPIDNLD